MSRPHPRTRRRAAAETTEIAITPMIDCVFLMLIYFMTTSSLDKEETRLGFQLPAPPAAGRDLAVPDEQEVRILADGTPVVNGYACDDPAAPRFSGLEQTLRAFRESAGAFGDEACVSIAPDPDTLQTAVVRAMDAVNAAGIERLRFAVSGSE